MTSLTRIMAQHKATREILLFTLLVPMVLSCAFILTVKLGYWDFPFALSTFGALITLLFVGITLRAASAVNKMEKERNATELQLKSTEATFRGFLENAPDAVVIIDGEGIIQLVNKQSETIFCYTRDELIGKKLEILLPERFRHRHVSHRLEYRAAPNVRTMGVGLNLFGRRKDGTEFPVDISISPLASESGTLFSSAIRDISDRRALEKEREFLLEQEQTFRARAENAARLRDDLVAMVSHDLKNPLTSILLGTQLMERSQVIAGPNSKVLERMRRSAEQMQKMIKDLLDSHQIEAGRFDLKADLSDCNTLSLVQKAIDSQKIIAHEKGLTLEASVPSDVPQVLADSERVQQVFQNLIGNAIKFTQNGGAIKVSAEALGADIVFSISDNGPGIGEGLLAHIFERFSQDIKTAKSGSGLGLSIAKAIVEAHGGRIWAESALGAGTNFFFTLPQVKSAQPVLAFS